MGKRAVAREKGVLDVVMQLRRKPFGEWILVYFDKTKISERTLLSLAQKRGCKRAAVIKGKKKEIGNVSLLALNPYLCAGDTAAIGIKTSGTEKLSLELPEGWSGTVPEQVSGTEIIFIQTPPKVKQGQYEIHYKSGSDKVSLKFHIVEKIK